MTDRHQTPQSKVNMIASNPLLDYAQFDVHKSAEGWLVKRDISVYDLPYVSSLLQFSYKQWLDELPESVSTVIGTPDLYDYTYMSIEGGTLSTIVPQQQLLELVSEAGSKLVAVTAVLEQDHVLVAVPIVTKLSHICAGVLVYRVHRQLIEDGLHLIEGWSIQLRIHFYRELDLLFIQDDYRSQLALERETNRRRVIHDLMRHLHDHIDVDSVLSQIIDSVEQLMPTATIEVYLSQDHRSENPHVKVLTFQSTSDPLVMQVFMNGEPCYMERRGDCMEVVMALTGKQGSYGVLKLTYPPAEEPNLADMQLVQLIVETAGTAFENAKLYEHAHTVIQELRFINDLTKRINQSLRLKDVFHDSTHELLRVFRADFCMLLQFESEEHEYEVVSSNRIEFNGMKLSADSGLFGYMRSLRESVIISDTQEYDQERVQFFEQLLMRSIIAVPLFGGGEMVGIVVVADKRPNFFSYDNYKLLQMLASHLGLAIANATLHSRVKHLANKDQVTGLYARHYLDKQINKQLRNDSCGSLIVIDIDLFKKINDTFGHQAGDRILKQVGAVIQSSIREADIAARWGGEEFAIYLPQLTVAQAMKVAERIRTRVVEETEPAVTISCGIAEWNWQDDKISVESLFYRADMAMYEAKDTGRNRIRTRA